MRILQIMTSSLTFNGIGMSIMNYFRNINNENIHIDFAVPNEVEDQIRKEIEQKNCKIFQLISEDKKKLKQRHPIKYYKEIHKIIKANNYDIVHVHGSSSMMCIELLAAKKAGCKVRIAHSRNTESDNNKLHFLLKPFFKKSYTDAFACGKEAGEWLFGKNKEVTIIPNGKDSDEFKFKEEERNKIRKEYNLENKIVIGHVGNFFFQKNHEFLIDVFKELTKKDDRYVLVLVGFGTLQDEIEKKVVDLGIENKVVFLGKVTNISEWLNAMDIMVFPSRFEGFPNVLIEWQISGLPCIISDTITKDVKITDLVKFKSLQDSPEDWAKEIIKIELKDRNNTKYIEQIKEAGYDIKENAKMLENLYIDLYNKKVVGENKNDL